MNVLKEISSKGHLVFLLIVMLLCRSNSFALAMSKEQIAIRNKYPPLIRSLLSENERDNAGYVRMAVIHEGFLIGIPSMHEVIAQGIPSMQIRKKEKKALYEKASAQGNYLAQNNLGVMLYEEGKLLEAAKLLQMSASQNYAPAQCNLAKMYLAHYETMEKSLKSTLRERAKKLLFKSAKQGLQAAAIGLGQLLIGEKKQVTKNEKGKSINRRGKK